MRRRNGNGDADVPNLQMPETVEDAHLQHRPARGGFIRYPREFTQRHRLIGFVLEELHRPPPCIVAHRAQKKRYSPCLRMLDGPEERRDVNGVVGESHSSAAADWRNQHEFILFSEHGGGVHVGIVDRIRARPREGSQFWIEGQQLVPYVGGGCACGDLEGQVTGAHRVAVGGEGTNRNPHAYGIVTRGPTRRDWPVSKGEECSPKTAGDAVGRVSSIGSGGMG